MKPWLKPSLNWLLVFVPAAAWLEHSRAAPPTWVFLAACLSILPLAGWLGHATEHLAARTSESVGGLLNATFGNAAELIIALAALRQGLHEVVKASITGSIIGNVLLVGGLAMLAGGWKHRRQTFNRVGAQTQATLLLLAAFALVVPAMFHAAAGEAGWTRESTLALEISVVLLLAYAASLVFSLVTHRSAFRGLPPAGETAGETHPVWSARRALLVLAAATALIAWMSEILVGSVGPAAEALGMTSVFVGVIVVAVVGNAAEHSTAVLVALKNRMDLSMGIAIGSSIQVALFVAPLLVVVSHFVGPRSMDLLFSLPEVVAVVLSVLIVNHVAGDGESNWLEGLMLLAVYAILAMAFYMLPETANVGSPAGAHP